MKTKIRTSLFIAFSSFILLLNSIALSNPNKSAQNTISIIKDYNLKGYKSQYHLPHFEYFNYVTVDVDRILNLNTGDVITLELPTKEIIHIKITDYIKKKYRLDTTMTVYEIYGEPLNKKQEHHSFIIYGIEPKETKEKFSFNIELKINSDTYIMHSEGEKGFLFKNKIYSNKKTDIKDTTSIIKNHNSENYKSKYHLPHYKHYDYVTVEVENILSLEKGDIFTLNFPDSEAIRIRINNVTKEPLIFMPDIIHYEIFGDSFNRKNEHENFKIIGRKSKETGKYNFTMELTIYSGTYIIKSEGKNGILFKNHLDSSKLNFFDIKERPLTDEEADKIHNSEEFKKFYEENKDFIEQEEKEYKEWQEQFKQ